MDKNDYNLRIQPYINNAIAYLLLSVIWSVFWVIILGFNYVTLIILCTCYIVFYFETFHIDFKVLWDLSKKECENSTVHIVGIKEAILKRLPYSNDLFSFTYRNSDLQLFKIKVKINEDNKIKKFYAYLTPSEVSGFLYKGSENKYQIIYLKSSRAIVRIAKIEKTKPTKKHNANFC